MKLSLPNLSYFLSKLDEILAKSTKNMNKTNGSEHKVHKALNLRNFSEKAKLKKIFLVRYSTLDRHSSDTTLKSVR